MAARMSLEQERSEVERLRVSALQATSQRELVDAALLEAKLALERAHAETKTTRAAMAQLLPLISEAKSKNSSRGTKKHA
jgi:Tfp pilus assembly protein PilE